MPIKSTLGRHVGKRHAQVSPNEIKHEKSSSAPGDNHGVYRNNCVVSDGQRQGHCPNCQNIPIERFKRLAECRLLLREEQNAGAFIGQLSFIAKLIPDLNWKVEEMIQAENRIIVRGRARGSLNGPVIGVDGKGKGLIIMSIDIHTIKDCKIANTYHVEFELEL